MDITTTSAEASISYWSSQTHVPTRTESTPAQLVYVWQKPLTEPLYLDCQLTEQGEYLVSYDRLAAYGVGGELSSAVEDLISMLASIRDELEGRQDKLSRLLYGRLQELRRVLE